jgi:ubiquinone/menaquinone biosynthesis C-methylase UbiE
MNDAKNITTENPYTKMQQDFYDNHAIKWDINNLDAVVGQFNLHNSWEDYGIYLFKDIENIESKVCLDFGCGPGRNIVKFYNKFKRIDGVDISSINIDNAKKWISHNNLSADAVNLYACNGIDLSQIPSEEYDVVMSTICLQHICVYEIRFNYLCEFYRILKPGGQITIQMGYGDTSVDSVGYYENNYEAISTNRGCDTRVESPDEVKTDLFDIGFTNFNHYIRPTGPGDNHPNWIYFNAQKEWYGGFKNDQ